MLVGNITCAQAEAWHQGIYKRTFAHTAVTGHQHCTAGCRCPESIYPLPCACRYHHNLIADRTIKIRHGISQFTVILIPHITLIEYDGRRNAICLCRSQKPVYKSGRSLRLAQRDHQKGLIDIGGKYMALFGQIGRTANNVITPRSDSGDKPRAVRRKGNSHHVPYRHRIGSTYALDTETAFHLAPYQPAVEPASGATSYQLPVFLTTVPCMIAKLQLFFGCPALFSFF